MAEADDGLHLVSTTLLREADDPALIEEAMRFRKRELVDGLGWRLPANGPIERDEFDRADTIHCVIRSGGPIVGYFRAIRADRPYLALTRFPALATLRPYPRHAYAWEISRIAVTSARRRFTAALLVYAAMFHFGRAQDAVSLCGFVDLNHERLLARLGINSERYGEPAEIDTDLNGRPVVVVAGELPVQRQAGIRFEKLMSLIGEMEIDDAAAVLGPARLSA